MGVYWLLFTPLWVGASLSFPNEARIRFLGRKCLNKVLPTTGGGISERLQIRSFVRMNQALCVCLTIPTQSTFLGSVCKSFVRLGHHNGWTAWPQWKISVSVFPKTTSTHYQFENRTRAQQPFDY